LATTDTATNLPDRANVVIIGGGIIGTSVAYHLAKLGVDDIVLLERDQLTSGTTWHAAGLINTFGSLSGTCTSMRMYSRKLYQHMLPHETGMDTGFMPVGFIELACDEDRLHYYRRVAAFNRLCGVQVKEITPFEVKDKFPLCDIEKVLAGFYVPDDGRVNPYEVTMALAKGAKMRGVQIHQGVSVTGVTKSRDPTSVLSQVTGVTLDTGHVIQADTVVNCAGMWARQLGEVCGVSIPNQAAEHYYLLTDDMPEVDRSWPVIEDSSRCVYVRPEGGGLMLGLFEWEGATWNARDIPNEFSFGEIEPDWDRMGPYLEKAMEIVPATMNVGAKKLFCGPESFTPDNRPIVGEAPELKNYYVAAGLNSIGILTGGGTYMCWNRSAASCIHIQYNVLLKPCVHTFISFLHVCRYWKDSCRVDSQQACTT
jgi:4-methylaminobutanoate oxidase (formaldehyde-forming)